MTTTRSPMRRRLPEDLILADFRARAGRADADNEYFHEDLEILLRCGYLAAAVPEELGGWGLDLASLALEQRRLARFAPATALGLGMHHYWIGTAVEHHRAGDDSLRWVLDAAVAGELFAAGHAEAGNDAPVVMSTALATPVPGGYRINGHKMFGSNGPAWRFLGVHALDVTDPDAPMVVHGFVEREATGVTVVESWDAMGMRPSQSYDTLLDDVYVPADRLAAVVPAGSQDHPFLAAMNVWALSLLSNAYVGLAERALELATSAATSKESVAVPGGTAAHNPMVQHQVADMYLELDAARATIDRLVEDWCSAVDHGPLWPAQIVSAKWRATGAARRVVDLALEITGGGGMMRGTELERLYRDARCGGFHPANDALTHELVAKAVLGIDPGGPRW